MDLLPGTTRLPAHADAKEAWQTRLLALRRAGFVAA
jgi:hypothetical protein